MKLKKVISFICAAAMTVGIVSMCGCDSSSGSSSESGNTSSASGSVSTGDTAVSGTSFQKNMNNGNYGKYISCETNDGYYFLLSNYLCYADKSNMNTTILCGKPECNHNTTDCNAYLDGAETLAYYDGNIYYDTFDSSEGVFYLYKMNTDGTERTKLQNLWKSSGSTSHTPKFIIDGGMVYIEINDSTKSDGSNENVKLYAAKLGTDIDDATLIDTLNDIEFDNLWADGGTLYYMATVDGSDKLYSYDISSEKVNTAWTLPSSSEVGSWVSEGVGVNGWYISGGCLYYFLSGNGMYKYDLSTQKNECVAQITDSSRKGMASFDDNYMYINCSNPVVGCEKNEICVYTISGEYVGTVSYDDTLESGDGYNEISLLCTSNGNLFVVGDSQLAGSDGYEYGIEDVFYVPIADIDGGKFEKLEFDLNDYVVNFKSSES